jgi:DNA-binding PadR family transcriptional regulator
MTVVLERELTTLEYMVLGMVGVAPQSGYTIMSALDSGIYSYRSASPGSVYPMLKRLEKVGILASELEMIHETRPRKMYTLTALGEELLEAWLRAPVTKNDVSEDRDITLMKFLFAEQRLSHDEILGWLDSYWAAVDMYEKLLRAMRDPTLSDWSLHQRLILEATLMDLDMQRGWIERAREELRGEERGARSVEREEKSVKRET